MKIAVDLNTQTTKKEFLETLTKSLTNVPDSAIIEVPTCGCCAVAFPVEQITAEWPDEPEPLTICELREVIMRNDDYVW